LKTNYRAPEPTGSFGAERLAQVKADFNVQYAGSNSEHVNRRDIGLNTRSVLP
jgi:hypothetical protein